MPAAAVAEPSAPIEVVLAQYRRYLSEERGLSVPVAEAYSRWVVSFVNRRTDADGQLRFAELTANDIAGSCPRLCR